MKSWLKLEYVALFAFSIYLYTLLPYPWWLYLALILTPDAGMLGYFINDRVGAYTYNVTHSLATAFACIITGSLLSSPYLGMAGIILVGHIGLDRLIGFGLKYPDSFKHTHLGDL